MTTTTTDSILHPQDDSNSRVEKGDCVDESTGTGYDQEKILTAPLDYLQETPGKDIRGNLIEAFNEFLNVPQEKIDVIKRVVGLLHNASLLIDDIQDSSKLRRGVPVAHSIFGIAQTINSANYAYFIAQRELKKLTNPEASVIFTEELINLHRGQGMELHWRDSSKCPSEKEYTQMVLDKTGGLFRLAIRLMQGESTDDRDYIPLVEDLGVLFQIRDDYQNLQSDTYRVNKGFCEDITEGKFSYPIIHSIQSRPGDLRLYSILRQRSEDIAVKQYAVDYIRSTGSFLHCEQRMVALLRQSREKVRAIAGETQSGSKMEAILDMLAIDPSYEGTAP
ncbi:hypothetical protein N7461_000139 [Penicillium sp. DV-2018c]|nr:hypothetical protein N7461_000139 [Penicillium sp. DV-2018c]